MSNVYTTLRFPYNPQLLLLAYLHAEADLRAPYVVRSIPGKFSRARAEAPIRTVRGRNAAKAVPQSNLNQLIANVGE